MALNIQRIRLRLFIAVKMRRAFAENFRKYEASTMVEQNWRCQRSNVCGDCVSCILSEVN